MSKKKHSSPSFSENFKPSRALRRNLGNGGYRLRRPILHIGLPNVGTFGRLGIDETVDRQKVFEADLVETSDNVFSVCRKTMSAFYDEKS